MKKFTIMAFAFVLTATMFAGCRRNPDTTGSTGDDRFFSGKNFHFFTISLTALTTSATPRPYCSRIHA